MLVQLHFNGVSDFLPRQVQPLLFMLADPAFGCAHQVEGPPFRFAHLLQDRFTRNASVPNLLEKAPQGRVFRRVPTHYLIGQRKPIRRHHQGDDQLQTVWSFYPDKTN
jgi:hypothetical protein